MTHIHTAAIPRAVNDVLGRAAVAAPACAQTPPHDRARALVAIADRLDESEDELIGIVIAETGLAEEGLRRELRRTTWKCGSSPR